MPPVRKPAVAGSFYPASEAALRRDVEAMLRTAVEPALREGQALRAVIVPHAGYVYSGPVAATAYRLVAKLSPPPRRVVLLGPSHRAALDGLALPESVSFLTPLGSVPVDAAEAEVLRKLPFVEVNEAAHKAEHSLEVQLPFLQTVLGSFSLLPLTVGRAAQSDIADLLERFAADPDALIVVSSDLSHFLPDLQARNQDRMTAEHILALRPISDRSACGGAAVNGLLELARRKGLSAEQLDLRTSADTGYDPSEVVGYGSFAFWEGG